MKSALDRATEDGYHKLDPLGHGQELKALQDSRAKRREIASNEFLSLLHRHEMTKHGSFLQVGSLGIVTVHPYCLCDKDWHYA